MHSFNFLNLTNLPAVPVNPRQENAPQQAPTAPGPHLQPFFQQRIPLQQAMANPKGNLPLAPLLLPATPEEQALPPVTALMSTGKEERSGVKRKQGNAWRDDAAAAGISEHEAAPKKKKIRFSDDPLESPLLREGYFIPDETLLLAGEKEDLSAKLKIQRALEGEYGTALEEISKLLVGEPLTRDHRREVIAALEDMVSNGYVRGAFALAFVILTDPASPMANQECLLGYYRKGAELGCRDCYFNVGAILSAKNTDGAKDAEVAHYWRVAAALGHPAARFNYARRLLQGVGVEADPVKAIELIEENAALLDQPEAQFELAFELSTGRFLPKDLPRAYELFKRAASLGHADAELSLAEALLFGKGTVANKSEACALYKKCADRGHPTAQYNYAVMKLDGDGVDANEEEGVHYLQLSADQNYPSAQYFLALRYAAGDGVPMDKKRAFQLFKSAADRVKHIQSMFHLGKMYETGDGIDFDIVKALEYYLKATRERAATSKVESIMKVNIGRGEYLT